MIRCQNCGTPNIDGSQYCDECGSGLQQPFAENKTRYEEPLQQQQQQQQPQQQQQMSNFQPQYPETPVFQSANVTSVGIPIVIDEAKAEEKTVEKEKREDKKGVLATLVIERGESVGTEFTLSADESYIGRWDADNGIFPDVDLDAHDPEAKVSRRHARIKRDTESGRFMIEDLGSTNGTFVNRGRRLIPGNPNILNDGDEIIVGKTFLRFFTNE
jgi:hypothetical protein